VPSIAVVDTGPLVALYDGDEAHHVKAVEFFSKFKLRLHTTVPVITEVMYLLQLAGEANLDFLATLQTGAVEIVDLRNDDWKRIGELMRKYSDVRMDFADASVVAIAERLGTRTVVTLDSDFVVYRYRTRQTFTNAFPIEFK
jgi:predicted nucleic acid-binding protein